MGPPEGRKGYSNRTGIIPCATYTPPHCLNHRVYFTCNVNVPLPCSPILAIWGIQACHSFRMSNEILGQSYRNKTFCSAVPRLVCDIRNNMCQKVNGREATRQPVAEEEKEAKRCPTSGSTAPAQSDIIACSKCCRRLGTSGMARLGRDRGSRGEIKKIKSNF